ncbi:hypothetical protein ACNHKA_06580 [Klebsiella michiganensis]
MTDILKSLYDAAWDEDFTKAKAAIEAISTVPHSAEDLEITAERLSPIAIRDASLAKAVVLTLAKLAENKAK